MIKSLPFLSTGFLYRVNRITSNLRYRGGLCINCLSSEATDGLCKGCRDDLPVNRWHCYSCALPLPFDMPGVRCGECLSNPPPFTRTLAPWRYQFPVDRMISRYKYQGQRTFARPLTRLFCEAVEQHLAQSAPPSLIIPAPMDRARQRNRGFNQAEDIACEVGRHTGIAVDSRLAFRTRATDTQQGLSRDRRMANLAGVFATRGAVPASIAIVDDVVTTGATTRQLAGVLMDAGAEEVQVWALARTP